MASLALPPVILTIPLRRGVTIVLPLQKREEARAEGHTACYRSLSPNHQDTLPLTGSASPKTSGVQETCQVTEGRFPCTISHHSDSQLILNGQQHSMTTALVGTPWCIYRNDNVVPGLTIHSTLSC